MSFFKDMTTTEKIVMGIAVASFLIAVYFIFSKKSVSEKPKPVAKPQPEPIEETPIMLDEPKAVLVMFSATWCGHCQSTAPAWDEVTQNFDGANGVRIIKVDADQSPDLCQMHSVQGFPTIKYCPNGLDDPNGVVYQGDRSPASIVEFLRQNNH